MPQPDSRPPSPPSFQRFAALSRDEIEAQLETSEAGLTKEQAKQGLQRWGANSLINHATHWSAILRRQFVSTFVYLLFGAAVISLLLGEYIDGSMILLFILINAGLGFYQEFHSEHTVALLSRYVVRTTKVVRDGVTQDLPTAQLVPGDLIHLEAGDMVSADLRFIETHDLTVDESVLTGESVPVAKQIQPIDRIDLEPHQASNIGFTGTTIASGHATGIVFATGQASVLGDIAQLATETNRVSSFEKGINRFSVFILRLIVVTLLFLFVTNLLIKSGGGVGWVELAIFSIALAVSVIPEALPVVMTFSLSRGALRLAKNQVVVKRLSAIEDLGSIEVLCTDKTGTLTENALRIVSISSSDENSTLRWAAVASSAPDSRKHEPNNAFDLAIWNRLSDTERQAVARYRTIEEIPFDPERRRNSRLVEQTGQQNLIVRGAPELLLEYCQLTPEERHQHLNWVAEQGKLGCRVIAICVKQLNGQTTYQPTDETTDLTLVGLLAFADPIKPSTAAAVAKAERLGLRIKILTGDSREVAGAVAKEIGLITDPAKVITGEEILKQSPADQLASVENYSVFARVSPQHKYHIIKLLQHSNEVGFLGEGINDAPALKAANVALAVEGAADIAREAADIVLLKQDLEVIVDGIREGREVFANTIKYLKITLASNFGNFYAIAVASLLIDYLPMLPLQILLVNLLSDFPMIAIAADSTDPEELRRPRNYDVKEVALIATILGAVSSVFDFIFFAIFSRLGEAQLHVYWFIGSILTELALIFSLRTRQWAWRALRPSAVLIWLTGGAAVITITLPFLHWAQRTFSFIEPEISKLWLVLGIVVTYALLSELVKRLYYHFRAAAGSQ